jgi:phosphopantetheinyl transferase
MGRSSAADAVALTTLAMGEEGIEVALLDMGRLGDPEFLASRFLAFEEYGDYAQLRHPLRRRDWLGARVCLKVMLLRRGVLDDPLQCAVTKDARGRPSLSLARAAAPPVAYECSISHKGRFACAALSAVPGIRIGVDVEEISPRLVRLGPSFTGARDVLLDAYGPEERLTILWALKEAASKALGVGLGLRFSDIACEEIGPSRHRLTTPDGHELRARHRAHEGYVVALAVRADAGDAEQVPRAS